MIFLFHLGNLLGCVKPFICQGRIGFHPVSPVFCYLKFSTLHIGHTPWLHVKRHLYEVRECAPTTER